MKVSLLGPYMSLVSTEPHVIVLPRSFTFMRGFVDFEHVLRHFDWTLNDTPVVIDLSACEKSNYQSLALMIQYSWFLGCNGCNVTFRYGLQSADVTKMVQKLGTGDWRDLLRKDSRDFTGGAGKTLALRRRADVQNAVNIARGAIRNYAVGFPDYLSYIISELLYNATEHGRNLSRFEASDVIVPSIFQFGKYPFYGRLVFFFSDLGMGVKRHLEQTYDPFPTHQEAIKYALRPNVSGTFRQQQEPYAPKNNAGMGLAYTSSMLKRLRGDMHIVSHSGLVHVSPEDVTTSTLEYPWHGTFVLVTLDVREAPEVSLEQLLGEIRVRAAAEIDRASDRDELSTYRLSVYNYFGKWAEDKDLAINFRDRYLIPAVEADKKIILDFQSVETAPHSFLNALLAGPVQLLGVRAYQRIKVYNAPGTIHEIIQTVIETNVGQL